MNLLDENIPLEQRDLLEAWGIRCRAIGQDVSYFSIRDENLITLFHDLKAPTFFTRDLHFFKRQLCHARYALVYLEVAPGEAAYFIRRLLRHHSFNTKAKRMGVVARVRHGGIRFWRINVSTPQTVSWPKD